jgi:hypothetical protein
MYNLNYAPTTFGRTELKRKYNWGFANEKGWVLLASTEADRRERRSSHGVEHCTALLSARACARHTHTHTWCLGFHTVTHILHTYIWSSG